MKSEKENGGGRERDSERERQRQTEAEKIVPEEPRDFLAKAEGSTWRCKGLKGEIGNIGKDQINTYHVKDFGLYSESIGNPQKGFFFPPVTHLYFE